MALFFQIEGLLWFSFFIDSSPNLGLKVEILTFDRSNFVSQVKIDISESFFLSLQPIYSLLACFADRLGIFEFFLELAMLIFRIEFSKLIDLSLVLHFRLEEFFNFAHAVG